MAEVRNDLNAAIQRARAGLTTQDGKLFLRGVNEIREFAASEGGLTEYDIWQIIKIMGFLFQGAYANVDGLQYSVIDMDTESYAKNIKEVMARMISDLITA